MSCDAQATTPGGGGTLSQTHSFKPTNPPGFVTRTYSFTAFCLSSGNAVTDSVMTASKRASSKGRSCASAILNSTLSATFSLLALSLDLSTILVEISTPVTRQPYFLAMKQGV